MARLLALGTTAVRGLDERAVFVVGFAVTAGLAFLVDLADLVDLAVACLDLGGAFLGEMGAASGGCNWLGSAAMMLFVEWAKSTGSLDH